MLLFAFQVIFTIVVGRRARGVTPIRDLVNDLKQSGISLYSIGVRGAVSLQVLQRMASGPQYAREAAIPNMADQAPYYINSIRRSK